MGEREREMKRERERERRSWGGTYSDEVAGVTNGSLAGSPASWSLVRPNVYRLVLMISEDTPYEERCTALTHNGAATRECPLSRVAESHGDPGGIYLSVTSFTGASVSPKMGSRSQGQNNSNRSQRARDSASSLSLCLSLSLTHSL